MTANQQQISKGFYKYAQINDFITVKNYIYLRQNEKKCLLLRFANDSDFTVDSLEFVLIQLDSNGKVISKNNVIYNDMKLKSGEMYVENSAILVDEYCSDFKVVILRVLSGEYVYTLKNGRVIVNYSLPERTLVGGRAKGRKRKLKVKRAFKPHGNIAAFAALVALVAAILFSSAYMAIKFINTVFPSKYLTEYAVSLSPEELENNVATDLFNE